ncbi:MAG TPA: bifunctional phosphopantothenoylcysteine decarboxylase/phosphopantothenate--cysteine ligase CoaBC [Polyangiaceae bacterium LLY-WYZ-14_1]|nr:bifunctional phosphopantothenoylcysteine decarboxylase/phosphopantothenate--cysteine ligase CoaBC [Polyangiaceae bacterium LLY-WYZ-14_1]
MLDGRRIAVAVGGGIAAYKAVTLVRELVRRRAEVRVMMTESATRFVGPVTFTGVTGQPALVDLWDPEYAGEAHIQLATWAELVVVAPATANLMSRVAHGLVDDLVLATLAATRAPVLFAPAMHSQMWERPPMRRVVALLQQDGARFVGPVEGPLASGEKGVGRMSEPTEIAEAVAALMTPATPADLAGRRLVVSAGPTVEDLDPVRFLGNRSSGKMGFALARRAAARGARVTLVTGPVELETPPGVARVDVRAAVEMQEAVLRAADGADAVIMAAAVADYRPAERQDHKIKKGDDGAPMTVTLVRNPDILADLGQRRGERERPVLVGFAVETRDLVSAARRKLDAKGCDLIVANDASEGFAGDTTRVVLVDRRGEETVPPGLKTEVADRILDRVAELFLVA